MLANREWFEWIFNDFFLRLNLGDGWWRKMCAVNKTIRECEFEFQRYCSMNELAITLPPLSTRCGDGWTHFVNARNTRIKMKTKKMSSKRRRLIKFIPKNIVCNIQIKCHYEFCHWHSTFHLKHATVWKCARKISLQFNTNTFEHFEMNEAGDCKKE